jgi:hypothetical protein
VIDETPMAYKDIDTPSWLAQRDLVDVVHTAQAGRLRQGPN